MTSTAVNFIEDINNALNQLDFYRVLKSNLTTLELDAAMLLDLDTWPKQSKISPLVCAVSDPDLKQTIAPSFDIQAEDEIFSAMRSSHSPRIWNANKTAQSIQFFHPLEQQCAMTIPLHSANGKHYALLAFGEVSTNDHRILKNLSFFTSLFFDRYYETILIADEVPVTTKRELNIIHAMSLGKTPNQIAIELGLSQRAIVAYIARLQKKLQAKNLEQLIAQSIRVGLIN